MNQLAFGSDGRRQVVTLLVVVAVTAAVLYGAAAAIIGRPIVLRDAFNYNASAVRLLNTGVYRYGGLDVVHSARPNAFTVPGYALFLAGIYSVLPHGDDLVADVVAAQVPVELAQLLLAICAAVLIAYAGYRLGGQVLGWMAGILAVGYVPFGMNATVELTETLALFLISVVVVCAVELADADSRSAKHDIVWAVALGVAGGLSTLVRPTALLWLAVPVAATIWVRRGSPRHALRVAGVTLACVTLVMLPWWARNAQDFRRFVPLTTSASKPLLDSVGGTEFSQPEEALIARAKSEGRDPYRAVAMSRLKAMWNESPSRFVAWKAWTLWQGVSNFTNLPMDIIGDINRTGLPPRGAFADAHGFSPLRDGRLFDWLSDSLTWYHRLLLVLSVIGVAVGRRRAVIWVLASIPTYYAVVHTIILFAVRYFYPAMPAVVLLAAMGAYGCWQLAAWLFALRGPSVEHSRVITGREVPDAPLP